MQRLSCSMEGEGAKAERGNAGESGRFSFLGTQRNQPRMNIGSGGIQKLDGNIDGGDSAVDNGAFDIVRGSYAKHRRRQYTGLCYTKRSSETQNKNGKQQ
jgi:hypothetical protein